MASARGRSCSPLLVLAVAAALVTLGLACSSSAGRISAASTTASTASTLPTTSSAPTTAAPTTTVDPGTLPQTRALPNTTDAHFRAGEAALWSAVVHDDPARAMPFFFPLSAYLQVKAISDPAADWHGRLVGAYQRDIHTMHAALGSAAGSARLLGLDVPPEATWVLPGQEYNKLPYWRVFGDALRYQLGDTVHSLPVYSLISWRGEWYVVHVSPP